MSGEKDFDSWNYAIIALEKELKFEQKKLESPVKDWEAEIRLRVAKKIKHYQDGIAAIKKDLQEKKNNPE